MRTLLFSLTFILLSFNSFSQKKELYYNEKYQRIEKKVFQEKLKSELFRVTSYENDTAKVSKLRYLSFFGTLDSIKNKQLHERLSKLYDLEPTEAWFMHYIPSLPTPSKMPDEDGIIHIDVKAGDSIFVPRKGRKRRAAKNFDQKKYSQKRHVFTLESYQESLTTWSNKWRSKVTFFHIYGKDNGFPTNFSDEVLLLKDPKNIIRRMFNDGLVPYRVIILHPNGDFFVSGSDLWIPQSKAINYDSYLREKRKWLKRISTK
jgi:hypothetical protein